MEKENGRPKRKEPKKKGKKGGIVDWFRIRKKGEEIK